MLIGLFIGLGETWREPRFLMQVKLLKITWQHDVITLADKKAPIESGLEALKKAYESKDLEAIKTRPEP